MKNFWFFILISIGLITFSCGGSDDGISGTPGVSTDPEWLIPSNEVMDGGPGKDGIPSIDNPQFTRVEDVTYLNENDLVVGIQTSGAARAYPHSIMDWHEIVNDDFAAISFSMTYCPLTGTAIAWDKNLGGVNSDFGVSGKLYNNNLMPYDRATDSYWSQLTMSCVNGSLLGTEINTLPIIETTWATWKKLYPNSSVLNLDTGFSRDYNRYPYGDYITNNDRILFPLSVVDSRLPSKDRVLGVIESFGNKVYPLDLFGTDRGILDVIGGQDVIVVGSKEHNLVVAFSNDIGMTDFQANFDDLPNLGQDSAGNVLDVTGTITAGPLAGQRIEPINGFMGYFFAFGAFYQGIEIFE